MRHYGLEEPVVHFKNVLQEVNDAVFERSDQLEEHLRLVIQQRPEAFRFVKGNAQLIARHEIELETNSGKEKVFAENVIIATGSRPRKITSITIDEDIIMTSDGISSLEEFPESLVIVGAGVIGCEFATIFSNFNKTKVHVISKDERILSFEDPDLAASLNHNFSLDAFAEKDREKVKQEYKKFESQRVGAHIDGPPFIALLINDRPGLQVVAAEGGWIDAPVTCQTAPGNYDVPVIPGSVIVNTGGTLMHLSEGRYSATLHRVNTTLIPKGETRVSMPYFLLPKMEGDLVPFGKSKADLVGAGGYESGRDRGANASVNRMGTFPQVTRRWWADEYAELRQKQHDEVEAETQAAYKLAKERGERFKNLSD